MEQKGTIIKPTYNFSQPKTTPNFINIPLNKVSLEKETLKIEIYRLKCNQHQMLCPVDLF